VFRWLFLEVGLLWLGDVLLRIFEPGLLQVNNPANVRFCMNEVIGQVLTVLLNPGIIMIVIKKVTLNILRLKPVPLLNLPPLFHLTLPLTLIIILIMTELLLELSHHL
jgi:hypothetical protein